MRRQVETWQRSELTGVTAKVVMDEAFVEDELEGAKHLARTAHGLYLDGGDEVWTCDEARCRYNFGTTEGEKEGCAGS
jgi:hypothetical protein